MHLRRFKLAHFRNFSTLDLSFSSQISYFYGLNGAGKTNLLESIYYLSTGHSFRTRDTSAVIEHGSEALHIYGEFEKTESLQAAGVTRYASGQGVYHLNHQPCKSIAEVTRLIPVQMIAPDSRKLLILGPRYRRQFLDWGVFHVEPRYYAVWLAMNRTLKQRNALLKQKKPFIQASEQEVWDALWVEQAEKVHHDRQIYVENFKQMLNPIVECFLPGISIDLEYEPGWDSQLPLQVLLKRHWNRDCLLGYTQNGPHKADLRFLAKGIPVLNILSQGQQKLLLYALLLAQGKLLHQQVQGRNCIFLVDDVAAELDAHRLKAVIELVVKMQAQVFLTAVESDRLATILSETDLQKFHVEQNQIFLG